MAEPEGLLIEGARRAAVAARELWWRARPPEQRDVLPLGRVRRRLELFTAALYADAPPILPSDAPPRPTWLARLLGRAPRHLVGLEAAAGTDGATVWLPRTLPARGGEAAALGRYRLLALEQMARAARGTSAAVPALPLERDLYELAEAIAVDAELARRFGGLAPDLRAARLAALRSRPPLGVLTVLERRVEAMVREVLAADPLAPPAGMPLPVSPAASALWARTTAAGLGAPAPRYRGVSGVRLWGRLLPATARTARPLAPEASEDRARPAPRRAALRQRPRVRQPSGDEDDDRPGTWMIRADDPMESAEDPMGLQRPADRAADAGADDLADALSELPEARVVATPEVPREVLESDGGPSVRATAPAVVPTAGPGIVYPEWDHRLGAYRVQGAVVRPRVASAGSGAWVDEVLARHAALVRRVRRRFDGLRPQRRRVSRQDDGPEIDVASYVASFGDRHAGRSFDDRFYVAGRPHQRDLAIGLLIDVSASTDAWVSGRQRIIDVEKESLIVLLEALHALGDRHAALAFSGEGPGAVRLWTIKDFAEPVGVEVRRRVAALEPDGYTRTGAAVRHASALLARQPARHRLLLIVSDGKPNDVDAYEGRYGVEDTRQAVAEARLQGLIPFCLTVDRQAPSYMPLIFGRRGYALLRHQDLLPAVLVEVVRRLLRA